MATVDGQPPCFLYHNVLSGTTLSASGGASLASGALADMVDGLTWHGASFSGFSGSNLIIKADAPAAVTTQAFTTVENPLATGWTNVGDEPLQAAGGAGTDSGVTSLGVGEVRAYVVTSAAQSASAGYAQAELSFPVIGGNSRDVGVMLRDPSDGSYVACVLWNEGTGTTVREYNGTTDIGAGTIGDSFNPLAATDYLHRVTWDGTTVRGYRENVLVASHVAVRLSGTFSPTQVGIIQTQSINSGGGSAEWDDFEAGSYILADSFAMSGQIFQGVAGADHSGTYSLAVQHSDDGSAWVAVQPYGWGATTPKIACDATVFLRWAVNGAHKHYRFVFTDVSLTPSGSVFIGAISLGQRLTFGDEYMASGFDPDAVSLTSEQNRNVDGQYVGGVVANASQNMALTFSAAGVPGTMLHDPDSGDIGDRRRLPSWGHFVKTCLSLGRPWWFQWRVWDAVAGLHCHEGSFYAYPDAKTRIGAPFMSPTRRRIRFGFDVMAEGYVGDFPLNDP